METAVQVSGLRDITPNNIESSGENMQTGVCLALMLLTSGWQGESFSKRGPYKNQEI